ncbi:hypothetical protein ABIB80_006673 [Bradyrhizobium sp. i1.15.2]|uniref:hypothetical protein n=1 Tax=Bradyrhizobium sp. i1.15.2 TaxID=3156362 RepID=UPI003390A094
MKSVHKRADISFKYIVEDAFEAPCKAFEDHHGLMEACVSRISCSAAIRRTATITVMSLMKRWDVTTTHHFDDVAIQRGRFDRNYQGTN